MKDGDKRLIQMEVSADKARKRAEKEGLIDGEFFNELADRLYNEMLERVRKTCVPVEYIEACPRKIHLEVMEDAIIAKLFWSAMEYYLDNGNLDAVRQMTVENSDWVNEAVEYAVDHLTQTVVEAYEMAEAATTLEMLFCMCGMPGMGNEGEEESRTELGYSAGPVS